MFIHRAVTETSNSPPMAVPKSLKIYNNDRRYMQEYF
jgi:hypothetical protein